jgi:hypothetical protein
MAEYIERKTAIAVACKGCNKEFSTEPCEPSECHIQQGLFNIPAADVVEVVRCKNCKFYHKNICPHWAYTETKPDDFCSYGERREGE